MDNGNDPPNALHVWKFLMKNMIPTNSGLTLSGSVSTTRINAKATPINETTTVAI